MVDASEDDDHVSFGTEIGAPADPINGIVAQTGLDALAFSCKYSKILDTISFKPGNLTIQPADMKDEA